MTKKSNKKETYEEFVEKLKAEKLKKKSDAIIWELSDTEKEIVKKLNY